MAHLDLHRTERSGEDVSHAQRLLRRRVPQSRQTQWLQETCLDRAGFFFRENNAESQSYIGKSVEWPKGWIQART